MFSISILTAQLAKVLFQYHCYGLTQGAITTQHWKGPAGRLPKAFTNAGQHSLGSVLTGELSSSEEPQPGCCWRHVHIQDSHSLKAISWVTAFQTTSSLQSPHWNQHPSMSKSAQVPITESRGQLLPVVWSEKIHNFKANLYRLTPERCWTSATSPENEGCKPLSTFLKNLNTDLLLNNYMIIQKFLIIWSFA